MSLSKIVSVVSILFMLAACDSQSSQNPDIIGVWATHGKSCGKARGFIHISNDKMFVVVDGEKRYEVGQILSIGYSEAVAEITMDGNNKYKLEFENPNRASITAAWRDGSPVDIGKLYDAFDITKCS